MGRHELFPNETMPNVKIPNPENGNNPELNNPKNVKGTKLGEGGGTKLGEHCSKVRLRQERMPIEPLSNSGFFSPFSGFGIFT